MSQAEDIAMCQIRFVIVLLIAGWANVTGAQTETEKLLAESDLTIQAQLAAVLDSASEDDAFQKARVLKKSNLDKPELLKQLVIFAATPGDEQLLRANMVLNLLDLQPKLVIRTLAPYLDTENKSVRSFVRDWFQAHDTCGSGPSSLMCLNYSDYLDFVQGNLTRNEETPSAFIEYIYNRSPGQALLIFTQANPQRHAKMIANLQKLNKQLEGTLKQQEIERRPGIPPMPRPREVKPQDLAGLRLPQFDPREIRLAELIISNTIRLKGFDVQFQKALPEAKEQLAMLAEHSEWWARLYAATIMQRHRELRLADVQEKLCEDSNELVRKAAKGKLDRAAALPLAAPNGDAALVAPRNVEARAIGQTKILVEWSPSVGATSYSLQRRRPDTEKEFTTIATDVKGTNLHGQRSRIGRVVRIPRGGKRTVSPLRRDRTSSPIRTKGEST